MNQCSPIIHQCCLLWQRVGNNYSDSMNKLNKTDTFSSFFAFFVELTNSEICKKKGHGRNPVYIVFFSDIALVVYFFTIGEQVWGALTVSFMAMSMLMMQVFSFHWHAADGTLNWKTLIAHILFLSPLHRFVSRFGIFLCLKMFEKKHTGVSV